MSIASTASQQSTASSPTAAASASSSASGSGANPLATLSGNFGNFLNLLMTQLKNQDPTSPLDANQFTSQLVQFSGVEQQINTNTSLNQLIQLTQAGELMQSSTMVGKTVAVTSDHLPLQNGSASLRFTASSAEPVTVTVYDEAGRKLTENTVSAQTGDNVWSWNGTNSAGTKLPDGSYRVAVTSAAQGATAAAIPFTVLGTATGMHKQGNGIQLELGALSVDFGAVQSVSTEN